MSVRCLILEDQAPARRILENYLARLSGFEVVGSAAAPSTATTMLERERVDLLFLDLGLPQRDGFEFLQHCDPAPVVIVTTAFPERAVEGFTHGVADYLVKPFAFERFRAATDRAVLALRARHDETVVTVPIERGIEAFVPTRDILALTADGDYVRFRTKGKTLHTLGPLSKWEAELPSPPFVRVHRSHLVNTDHVTGVSTRAIHIPNERLPVGSTYAAGLAAALKGRTTKAP